VRHSRRPSATFTRSDPPSARRTQTQPVMPRSSG
jgi:hypothetical protein